MDTVTLGRTGLQATVAGLGAGGPSRLGQSTGNSQADSIAVVHRALDLGINFFDTAEAYGTEPIVGQALKGVARSRTILSTKKSPIQDGEPINAAQLIAGVNASLRNLGTDYVDIFHLHGVRLAQYEHVATELVPALQRLRKQGKIRFLGITEAFHADPQHAMLARALEDPWWDVVMVGFNILNQSARHIVFPKTIGHNTGVLIMFAVRRAFSQPQRLAEILEQLVKEGRVDSADVPGHDPLDFLLRPVPGTPEPQLGAPSLPDAAYRFCRHEPGAHVVLTGTGNVHHLEENVRSLLRRSLPREHLLRLHRIFAGVDNVSGG
jgi:L-galactose dehydrogenase